MRFPSAITLFLLPPILSAASLSAQEGRRWSLSFSAGRDSYSGASLDTVTVPQVNVEVQPTPRAAFDFGLTRTMGAWEATVSAGYATGGLRAQTDDYTLDERTGTVKRYRGALLIGRRVAHLGTAGLHLLAGPVVDVWKATGVGDHTAVSARGGAAIRMPLGRLVLENQVCYTMGGSPFDAGDLPPGVETRTMRTWTVGVGLRYGL